MAPSVASRDEVGKIDLVRHSYPLNGKVVAVLVTQLVGSIDQAGAWLGALYHSDYDRDFLDRISAALEDARERALALDTLF